MAGVPIPPPPVIAAGPPARAITDESSPGADVVKIGVELEGVGTYKTDWNVPAVIAQPNFHDVFKRMPLVRSNSFGPTSGVAITPEDGARFGRSGPAELVSQPHVLTRDGLVALRDSVWTAIRKKEFFTGTAQFVDPRAPGAPARTATTRWGRGQFGLVGGSLQVTLGVSVAKLLSANLATRQTASELLIADAGKRTGFNHIVTAAVAAEQYLTSVGQPWAGLSATRHEGIRLLLLMSFLRSGMAIVPSAVWGKNLFGCNIKAQTSFKACNILDLELPFRVAATTQGAATFKTNLLNALTAAGVNAPLITALNATLNIRQIGTPGQSTQTSVEGWFAFPNFTVAGHLYCIIEIREGAAALNLQTQAFLNTSEPNKLPQPASAATLLRIRTAASQLHTRIITDL